MWPNKKFFCFVDFANTRPMFHLQVPARLPTINGTALTVEEQKVWKNFTRMNIKVEARPCVSCPMEEFFIRVDETDPVVNLIVGFAVDAFNDSYHKYVKGHRSKNITQAVPLVCECYKSISRYSFYVTLDAIEQWKPGVCIRPQSNVIVVAVQEHSASFLLRTIKQSMLDPSTRNPSMKKQEVKDPIMFMRPKAIISLLPSTCSLSIKAKLLPIAFPSYKIQNSFLNNDFLELAKQ
nr:40S ribosomal protein S13 [Tanacetum cinerariifolium]